MKKQCLIVLVTVATMLIGLGSLALVQGSEIVGICPRQHGRTGSRRRLAAQEL